MKLFITLILLLNIFTSNAQVYNGPESVEFDYVNNRWLIGNTGSHEILIRDSTGTLSLLAGNIATGPYGIEIVGDTVFCCSGGRIKGYLLSNGTQVFNVNLGATFLNGLTHDNDGHLITTDFNDKTIYKVNIAAQTDTMIASALIQSPNGIIFDAPNNRCVFVNWGSNAPVKAIDMSTFAVTTIISTTHGSCDGIARDSDGNYYISNWGAQTVVKYDSAFSIPPVVVASGLTSPADIFYNVADDTLAIPNSSINTVLFIGFSTVSVSEIDSDRFNIYPNPAKERINLSGEIQITEVCIYDLQGKIVLKEDFNQSIIKPAINVSLLNSGIYTLTVKDNNSSIVSKRFVRLSE